MDVVVSGATTTVYLCGEVDVELETRLEEVAEDIVTAGKRVVLNVAAVTFMDSTGAAFVMALIRGLGADRVTLVHPSDQVQFLMTVTRMNSLIKIHPQRG